MPTPKSVDQPRPSVLATMFRRILLISGGRARLGHETVCQADFREHLTRPMQIRVPRDDSRIAFVGHLAPALDIVEEISRLREKLALAAEIGNPYPLREL